MSALFLCKISAVAEFFDFLAAALLSHTAALTLRGRAPALLGTAGFPLYAGQSLDIGGKSVEDLPVYVVVHEISPFLAAKEPGVPQHLQMLRHRPFGELQLSGQRPDAVIVPEQQGQYLHPGLVRDSF